MCILEQTEQSHLALATSSITKAQIKEMYVLQIWVFVLFEIDPSFCFLNWGTNDDFYDIKLKIYVNIIIYLLYLLIKWWCVIVTY